MGEKFKVELTVENIAECRQLCSEYLGGPWTGLEEKQFDCSLLEGGLCNKIFVCSNKKHLGQGSETCPDRVVVRKYGHPWVGRRGDMISVCDAAIPSIAQVLFYEGMGPRIYGVFDDGRIEDYISHKKLDFGDGERDEILEIVLKKMVKIHDLEMPISKDPFWIFNFTEGWFEKGLKENQYLFEKREDDLEPLRRAAVDFRWREEMQWLRNRVDVVKSRVVFCHNDIQISNILLREDYESLEDQIFIVDYENCSYGFRDFLNYVFWPEKVRRKQLLEYYIKEYRNKHPDYDPELDSLEHLLLETDFYILLKLIFRISIGYRKYSEVYPNILRFTHRMMTMFNELKTDLIRDYPFLKLAKEV